jgi:hypothetical protein
VRRGEVVEVDAQRLAVKVGVVVVGHEEDEAEHGRGRLRWRRRAVVAVRGVRAELGQVLIGVDAERASSSVGAPHSFGPSIFAAQ